MLAVGAGLQSGSALWAALLAVPVHISAASVVSMALLTAGACLLVLREALTGWDALAAELREAAGIHNSAQDAAEISTAAQASADALCALHAAGLLRCSCA